MNDTDVGELFSRTYLAPVALAPDSVRFRRRLAAGFARFSDDCEDDLPGLIQILTGCVVPQNFYGPNWNEFFERGELRDILDSITIIHDSVKRRSVNLAGAWKKFVDTVLNDERLHYRLDDGCGVRHSVDSEFERSVSATIQLLGEARHKGARTSVELCMSALDGSPPDGLVAIRHCWDALENTFKQMPNCKAARLGSSELSKCLRPILEHCYSGRELNAARQMLESFSSWVNATHQYRHAPGEPESAAPPLELAVALISQGLGNLRWLLFLDSKAAAA